MRPALLLVILLSFSQLAPAQDIELQHRDAPKTNDLALPDKPTPLVRDAIDADSTIPEGMVWVPSHSEEGEKWIAWEQGACEWCSRPMTFKRAAFDKKMSLMWIGEIALAIADTEIAMSRPCVKTGVCREGNILLGPNRTQQYGIRIPVLFGGWMLTAHLRQGNTKMKIGGLKHWWIVPALYQAATTTGILSNLAR